MSAVLRHLEETSGRPPGFLKNRERIATNETQAAKLRQQLKDCSQQNNPKQAICRWPGKERLSSIRNFWKTQGVAERECLLEMRDPGMVQLFKQMSNSLRKNCRNEEDVAKKLKLFGLDGLMETEKSINLESGRANELQIERTEKFLPTKLQHLLFVELLPWEMMQLESRANLGMCIGFTDWRFLSWIYYVEVFRKILAAAEASSRFQHSCEVCALQETGERPDRKRVKRAKKNIKAPISMPTTKLEKMTTRWRPSSPFPAGSVKVKRTFISVEWQRPKSLRRSKSW